MGYFPLPTLLFMLLLVATPTSFAAAVLADKPPRPFDKVFAFGDSLTDTGNTVSATGPTGFNFVSSPPYGITFFGHSTNRYSDGRLIIDFVTQYLGLPFLPPYKKVAVSSRDRASHPKVPLHGVNFAVAGATAIPHGFFTKNNLTFDVTPQSIGTQAKWFNNYLDSIGCGRGNSCDDIFNDSLFWVGEIGVNDYAYAVGSLVSSSTIKDLAIRSLFLFLEALLTRGAKHLVVQGLPPTGCLTLSLSLAAADDRDHMGCVASVNNQSYSHNSLLRAKLATMRKRFPGATIVFADTWDAYTAILKNADHFGFKEKFKVCCGSGEGELNYLYIDPCGSPSSSACPRPSEFVNWDGVHLTEAMYKEISDMFLQGSATQPPFRTLVGKKGE